MSRMWRDCLGVEIQIPFTRITFEESVARYGSDRPDTRSSGTHGRRVSSVFAAPNSMRSAMFSVQAVPCEVCECRAPGILPEQSSTAIEAPRSSGPRDLCGWSLSGRNYAAPITKFLSERKSPACDASWEPNRRLTLLAADENSRQTTRSAWHASNRACAIAKEDQVHRRSRGLALTWVWRCRHSKERDEKAWISIGKPVLCADAGDRSLPDSDPVAPHAAVRLGDQRGRECSAIDPMHRADMQRKCFQILGLTDQEIEERFGWFSWRLCAHGAPPHGGVGDGVGPHIDGDDRRRLARDIIAFPKTQTGADPLTGAPASVDPLQLRDLGLRLIEKNRNDTARP